MSVSPADIEELRLRRERLGRRATYTRLGELVGKDPMAVHRVLNSTPSAIPMNREGLAEKIRDALDSIEAQDVDLPIGDPEASAC